MFSDFSKDGEHYGHHFFRKIWGGYGEDCRGGDGYFWAHKFKDGFVRELGIKTGKEIKEPEVEMRALNDYYHNDYKFMGYFLVKPDVTIYAP